MQLKTLSDRCKWFEKNFSPEVMIPELPVILRLDGCNFGQFTKGLKKPFDERLTQLMVDLTKFLVKETNAIIGYTQSDEITLILYSANMDSAVYNDGKKQKILSKLTGKAVSFFNDRRKELLPDHNKLANFDCRIFQVPNLHWACNQLLFRENDATKNSISMLAQSKFPHKELQGLNGNQMQDKLMVEKGINWNDLDMAFKRGTYVKRCIVTKAFTSDELESLPLEHNARRNPQLLIERSVIEVKTYPIFQTIKNKIDVVFNDAQPIIIN